MDIGTGLAIIGVWLFPVATTLSKTTSGTGWWISVISASLFTLNLMYSL